jgi:RimJ/RimL family protein N-acetyltransferase
MKHAYSISGYHVRLRPVTLEDPEFIVRLRTSPFVIGTVGDSRPDPEQQRQWLRAYEQRAGDYYFIVETESGTPVGTIGLYDVHDGVGEWGRWIILPGIPAALPSVILIHRFAFDVMKLRELRGCVVESNQRVISFHRRFGARQTHVEYRARQIGGKWINLVWILMERERWAAAESRLRPLAETASRAMVQATEESRFVGEPDKS